MSQSVLRCGAVRGGGTAEMELIYHGGVALLLTASMGFLSCGWLRLSRTPSLSVCLHSHTRWTPLSASFTRAVYWCLATPLLFPPSSSMYDRMFVQTDCALLRLCVYALLKSRTGKQWQSSRTINSNTYS